MYYKLLSSQGIVGVVRDDDFRKYQSKRKIVMFSNIENAQFVEWRGGYYRDDWLRPLSDNEIKCVQISIVRIEEQEYNALIEAFETQEEIGDDENGGELIIEPEVEPVNEDDVMTLEFVKEQKIAQMSKICHETIVNGVDVVLSDGESHHFSLEVEDQIKIQALALKAQSGEQTLFWHEDNKPCQFYSAQDILVIYGAMEQKQIFHTTYFNSLKMYIQSLNTIEEVGAITYNTVIPIGYQSEVLQYLLTQASNMSNSTQ